ncbi:MAG: hypothetical protein JSR19_05335 [Proteobacteria bacterium]|nr:hypothetical protein [Pseudomonadota bacterium]HQR03991.1 hypothetical protein [Rhodocyclaceae bacterium]
MKKILIAAALATVVSGAFATEVAAITGQTNKSSTTVINSGAAPSAAGTCSLLSSAVTINSSVANNGSIDCNDALANVGVAFANTSGKNNIYSASSAGGGITVTSTGSSVPTAGQLTTQSAAASAGGSS